MIPRAPAEGLKRDVVASESRESFWERGDVQPSWRRKGGIKVDMCPGQEEQEQDIKREDYGRCPYSPVQVF